MLNPLTEEGLVISHQGHAFVVEDLQGRARIGIAKRSLGPITVGDRVMMQPLGEDQARIEQLLPRRSLLTRPAHGGKIRPVAANLDQLVVILAPAPEPDWLLLDQYAAAAAHRDIDLLIILNKVDLSGAKDLEGDALGVFRSMDYRVLSVSARSGEGLFELENALRDRCSLFSGQSGVGKSSLTNALLPDKSLKTQALSAKAGLGRHTTTAAILFHLPQGGQLIDSPGVAVFGLAEMTARQLSEGYLDFRPHLDGCRFGDCRHRDDLGCAVRAAAEQGLLSWPRYQRYLKLLDKMHLG